MTDHSFMDSSKYLNRAVNMSYPIVQLHIRENILIDLLIGFAQSLDAVVSATGLIFFAV